VTPAAYGVEPGELGEAVGDDDAVKSTALGMKNLKRLAKMLVPLTTAVPADSYEDLVGLYNGMIGQWSMEMNHVLMVVGGVAAETKHPEQAGAVFQPVAKKRQKEAVAFLQENAFTTPEWALDPDILRRFEPAGSLDRVRGAQVQVLNALLAPNRLNRMVEIQAADPAGAWSPADFLAGVRKGIWSELEQPRVATDAYRRNLQRAWLEIATQRAAGPLGSGDAKPLFRAELKRLRVSLETALPRAVDAETRAHLQGAADNIDEFLNPKN
jgi:hypothetical protein